MSTYLVAAFLLLYGVMAVFHPALPEWVVGLLAGAAGIGLLVERGWPTKSS